MTSLDFKPNKLELLCKYERITSHFAQYILLRPIVSIFPSFLAALGKGTDKLTGFQNTALMLNICFTPVPDIWKVLDCRL